jgi:hypothetical protein
MNGSHYSVRATSSVLPHCYSNIPQANAIRAAAWDVMTVSLGAPKYLLFFREPSWNGEIYIPDQSCLISTFFALCVIFPPQLCKVK